MRKYRIDNECMRDILCFYCNSKSIIWNWFFGVKSTYNKNKDEWHYSIFMIPKRIYKMAEELAYKYDDYEVV